ncbi:7219_t:CDS:2 [Acaulospora colombiana]|nr:7219_t:CDS:2 [Acaulospora colombiana]
MSFNPLSMTEEEGRARSQEASQSEEKEILPSPPKPIIVRDFAYPEDDERFSRLPLELLPLDEREKRLQGQAHDRYEDAELTPLAQMTHSTGGDDDGSHYTYTESGAPDLLSPDLPLQPGIYRALYPFEAEGTAEMSLDEGQLVKVVGRGGGVGWAVVERGWRMTVEDLGDPKMANQDIDGSNGALALAGQALVPEGYLEPYRLDSS